MKPLTLILFYIFLVSDPATYSQTGMGFTHSQVLRLDSISTQDVPLGAPGIAAGIVKNGKIIYTKVAGYADLADSVLITSDTRFNIASNGKQFTALSILVLIDAKKLRLTDDIRRYLPKIYPGLKAKITIENLLNHTSGIRDVYDLWSLKGLTWWEHPFNNKDVLALLEKQQELNFPPGSKYLYSNTNYILLASIVEKVTARSFVDFTNELFKKLHMSNTSFEDNHANIRGPIAKAYFNFNTWTTYNWIWDVVGDGNIFSTLSDQLQWEQILQGASNTEIKKEVLEKSQQLTDHSTIKSYGYGLEFGTYKRLPYKFHEGATGAWKATVIRFPGEQVSIVTLTNTGKVTPNTQTRQMADVCFNLEEDKKYFVTKPPKTGEFVSEANILGIYQTENNFTFQFKKRDSVMYLIRVGRNDVQLERESNNVFHQTYDPDFKQEFKKNAKGEMEVTAYYTSHHPYTLKKVNANWNHFNYLALNGSYINVETNVVIKIEFESDKNYKITIGSQDGSSGLLISPVKLLVDSYIMEFKNEPVPPKTFLISAERIEKVKFFRLGQ